MADRVLLVAAYWRTYLTLRQLAPLFDVSKSAAHRIIDRLRPALSLQQRKRFRKDTVLIVDGTLVPTRDHAIAEQSKPIHVDAGRTDQSSSLQGRWRKVLMLSLCVEEWRRPRGSRWSTWSCPRSSA